ILCLLVGSLLLPKAPPQAQEKAPDLTVTTIEPIVDAASRRLIVSFTDRNSGVEGKRATAVIVSDIENKSTIGSAGLRPLAVKEAHKGRVEVSLRDEWRGTTRSCAAVVDPRNEINEWNEGNNEAATRPLRIGQILRPDLTVTTVEPIVDAASRRLIVSF